MNCHENHPPIGCPGAFQDKTLFGISTMVGWEGWMGGPQRSGPSDWTVSTRLGTTTTFELLVAGLDYHVSHRSCFWSLILY